MPAMPRAIALEDKEERSNAILDAAEDLYLEHPDRIASVAEVAGAAGLAKGTVYLYFPSKEEMLLALHERHVGQFFAHLVKLLDGGKRVGFEDVLAIARNHIIRVPGYLSLTSRCFGMMDREIPLATAIAFKERIAASLAAAGAGLERHFHALDPGGGAELLLNSYGLIVGLWQLLHPNKRFGKALERPELRVLRRDYERDVEAALRALWSGAMGVKALKERSA